MGLLSLYTRALTQDASVGDFQLAPLRPMPKVGLLYHFVFVSQVFYMVQLGCKNILIDYSYNSAVLYQITQITQVMKGVIPPRVF